MSTAIADKTAEKLRRLAEGLQKQIDAKRASRNENTPKRAREGMSARIDANHLERIQDGLRAIADAREVGNLPAVLEGIKSKADVAPLVKTKIDCSRGYYTIIDTGEFCDQSEAAQALRRLIEAGKNETAEDREAGELRRRIAQMETDLRFTNIPGFFPTPAAIIAEMLDHADIREGMRVLEPSAGKGDIAEAAREAGADVTCCEYNHTLGELLKLKGFDIVGGDFIERFSLFYPADGSGVMQKFDRVLMNPPFERGQDAEHVRFAFSLLKPGGRLVSVMSSGPFFRSDRKAMEFRAWFAAEGGEVIDLPADSFKGAFRETGVSCKLVIIDKD